MYGIYYSIQTDNITKRAKTANRRRTSRRLFSVNSRGTLFITHAFYFRTFYVLRPRVRLVFFLENINKIKKKRYKTKQNTSIEARRTMRIQSNRNIAFVLVPFCAASAYRTSDLFFHLSVLKCCKIRSVLKVVHNAENYKMVRKQQVLKRFEWTSEYVNDCKY